jgi:hypothetical protein
MKPNEERKAVLGKTVYLNETEDFDDVRDPNVDPKKIEEIIQVQKDMTPQEMLKAANESNLPKEGAAQVDLVDALFKSKDSEEFFEEGSVDISLEDEEDLVQAETKKEAIPAAPKKKAKTVDLSTFTVINKNEIEKERDLTRALYGGKSAFQIVAAQSGYMAKVLPLVHKDQINLFFTNLSLYEYKKNIYKVIWEKIHDTSVGKMGWEDWLRFTSVEDLETFYYGVYSSTFPNEGVFKFTCPNPKCGAERDYKISHNNLIKTTDKEKMRLLIDEVSKNATTIEKMKNYSLIGKNQALQLSESNIIVELRTPTLFDSLEILRTVPEKVVNKDAVTVTNLLYISKILIPSKDNEGVFTEEMKKSTILRVIDSLPIDDANELQNAVFDRVDENRISYSIKNLKCSECSEEVKDIPISVEDILFTLIFEKTQ